MLNEHLLTSEIIDALCVLRHSSHMKGALNFQDQKTASENFFKGLFNLVYSLNLINVNNLGYNAPAIDLADEKSGCCYQITYENTVSKIQETKEKYLKYELHAKFPKLIIFIFDKKPPGRVKDHAVQYEEDLSRDIEGLGYDKKQAVLEYLEQQLKLYKPYQQIKQTFEIQTIQKVISTLSHQPLMLGDAELVQKPCPEAKIRFRFNSFQEFILEEYRDLYASYESVLQAAKGNYIDDGNSGQIKLYLRRKSREYLVDDSGNAKSALTKLQKSLEAEIDGDISENALRYYLLSELMECDIFPLSLEEKELLGEDHVSS